MNPEGNTDRKAGRVRTFTVGAGDGYTFQVDRQGGLRALPSVDGSIRVIGGQLDLSATVSVPAEWSDIEDATGKTQRFRTAKNCTQVRASGIR